MTLLMKLPTRSRDVTAAAAVSVVQHSRTGVVFLPRLMKWSQHQTAENPASSALRAESSHHADSTPIDVRFRPIGIMRGLLRQRRARLQRDFDHATRRCL